MIRWLLDLAAVALLALLAGAALFSFNGPLRIALVLPLIMFVPGYAFLSALFPEESSLSRSRRSRKPWGASDYPGRQTNQDDSFLLGNIERIGLSVVLSLALVSLVVFGLNFTVGFDARRIGIMLLGFTGAMIIFAIARRIVLPTEERYSLELPAFPMDTTFVVMFAVSLLILVASVGAFAVMSTTGDPDTDLFAVAENESSGNVSLKAADDAMVDGRPATIVINNRERKQQQYTVIVAQETIENGEVADSEQVNTFTPTIADGETKKIEVQPPESGDRVGIYLYKGTPENPSRESAYRTKQYFLTSDGGDDSSDEDDEGSLASPQISNPQLVPVQVTR
ncbi:DUF1616 domain-containing protein [Halocatena marina]|uniref:DUF1616 domain-containing protein n=1 Tax=Halocatena marina TaxID=2934937 RepID=UPI0022241843|nr:DUF1616 domain-containing protein [Halocatena marina]